MELPKSIQHVTRYGITVVLGSYLKDKPILRLLEQSKGSFFHSSLGEKTPARKLWISAISKNNKRIEVDLGANQAIKKGSSLLPSGIQAVSSGIDRGDCVQLKSQGTVIGVGLSEYSSSDLKQIKGIHSKKIQDTLGFCHSDVVVHRDNLVFLNHNEHSLD